MSSMGCSGLAGACLARVNVAEFGLVRKEPGDLAPSPPMLTVQPPRTSMPRSPIPQEDEPYAVPRTNTRLHVPTIPGGKIVPVPGGFGSTDVFNFPSAGAGFRPRTVSMPGAGT